MKLNEVPLDFTKPLIVRREFTINGHPQYANTQFDWRRLAVSKRRVQQLYDTRKIIHPESKTFPNLEIKVRLSEENLAKYAEDVWVEGTGTVEAKGVMSGLDKYVIKDDLDAIDDMKELRAIAEEVGADRKVSKVQQREAIREARNK